LESVFEEEAVEDEDFVSEEERRVVLVLVRAPDIEAAFIAFRIKTLLRSNSPSELSSMDDNQDMMLSLIEVRRAV
jgi:hypothetical protein